MNRLRDESALDPVGERGIHILRNVERPPRPPEMKMRVWAALQRTPDTGAAGWRRGTLKLLVLGAGIVAFATTAAAGIGGHWIARRVEEYRAARAPAAAAVVHERPRVVRRIAEATPPAPAQEPAPAVVAAAPLAPAPVRESATPRLHRVVAAQARERTQVLDALIALRRDHDPVRAQALLDHYLEGSRRGALREEALVLAMEAADARSDAERATRLAHLYRDEYPAGRFTSFAQSHIRP